MNLQEERWRAEGLQMDYIKQLKLKKIWKQVENQTLASITYQNYFRAYKKLSGMTGTENRGR